MDSLKKNELKRIANRIRAGVIEATYQAKSGHPGGSLSSTDLLTYLYFEEMKVYPDQDKNPLRDRFVLSKGHAAPALYSTLAHRGFFNIEDLKTLRKCDSCLQGHPNIEIPGVDMSTGSLGQGVSVAVGMALSAKMRGENYRTYAILGDGELQEGQVWEAAMFAGSKKLDNLLIIIDNNNLQIDGTIEEINSPYPIGEKFAAFGFNVIEIDGHDFDEIKDALDKAKNHSGAPTAIIAKTIKGKGVSFMEDVVSWHGTAPNEDQYKQAMEELNVAYEELKEEEA